MNLIRTDELRNALLAALEFDRKHSSCISESTGQFTGNFWHETYEGFGVEIIYYFHGVVLTGYEYDAEKKRKADKEALETYLASDEGKRLVNKAYKELIKK